MAYHLYGMKADGGHLGKLNKSGWHLVYGDGKILLPPSYYQAYQIGNYSNIVGDVWNCDEGFIQTKVGTLTRTAVDEVIYKALDCIHGNGGHWIHGLHLPHFISCCGSTALGCFGNNTGTNEIAMQAGFYAMIPRLRFSLPEGKTALSARIRFKGYSDYLIEAKKVGSYSMDQWAYDFNGFRKNNLISGQSHTLYNNDSRYDTRGTDLLIAHAAPVAEDLPIKLAFMSDFWRGQHFGSFYDYSLVVNGRQRAVGTSHSLAYYLKGSVNRTYNATFCGAVGTNCFHNGASSESWDYNYPYHTANNGAKTYYSERGTYGQEFPGQAGCVFKKIGGNFYTSDMLNSTSKSDTTWLVKPYIDLPQWQVDALNSYREIWIMVSNPSPWFNTTDIVDTFGASRQIFLEDYRLEVELD